MPLYLLDIDGQVVNKTAATNDQAAENWARRWSTKQRRYHRRNARLTQQVCLMSVLAEGQIVTDREIG